MIFCFHASWEKQNMTANLTAVRSGLMMGGHTVFVVNNGDVCLAKLREPCLAVFPLPPEISLDNGCVFDNAAALSLHAPAWAKSTPALAGISLTSPAGRVVKGLSAIGHRWDRWTAKNLPAIRMSILLNKRMDGVLFVPPWGGEENKEWCMKIVASPTLAGKR